MAELPIRDLCMKVIKDINSRNFAEASLVIVEKTQCKKSFPLFWSSLRLASQEFIQEIISGKLPATSVSNFLCQAMKFVLIINKEGLVEYVIALSFIEDIFESCPIESIESLFFIFAEDLKTKDSNLFLNKENVTIVSIANSIIKRLSPSLDTSLRGKIQVAVTRIFSLYDPSGVNARGQFNTKNQNYKIQFDSDSQQRSISKNFFEQFWILHKHICNPLLIFQSSADGGLEESTELLDMTVNQAAPIMSSNEAGSNKVDIFFNNLLTLINYFAQNTINVTSSQSDLSMENVFSCPKFLTTSHLFELQIEDPAFRLIILSQIIISVKALIRPINVTQKKLFVVRDQLKSKASKIIESALTQIALMSKSYSQSFASILDNEEDFERWKENLCKGEEELVMDKSIEARIKESKETIKTKGIIFEEAIMLKPTFSNYERFSYNKDFVTNYKELLNYKYNDSCYQDINSENPYLGRLVERVVSENNPTFEIEDEDKIKNNPVRDI